MDTTKIQSYQQKIIWKVKFPLFLIPLPYFQMHLFQVAFFTAGTLFAFQNQPSLLFYFMTIVALYLILAKFLPGLKNLSIRKKIMAATWTPPSEGIIYAQHPVQVQKVLQLIESLPKESRPTLTHFVIKAIGELLHNSPSLNGKYVFGKFVKYEQSDVSCVVDIDEGKDLAIVLVEDVYNKNVQEITGFIKGKAQEIKSKKGDDEHKKRMGIIKYIPAFVVSLLLPVSKFIFHFLGVSIKPLSVKANQFGGAVLTSIGMIGFENATAPLIGVIGCSLCVTLNAICEKAVVEDGEIVTRRVTNINFAIDSRYVDTVECRNMLEGFMRVFEEPERYLRKGVKSSSEEQERQGRKYTLKLRTQPVTQQQSQNRSAKLLSMTGP